MQNPPAPLFRVCPNGALLTGDPTHPQRTTITNCPVFLEGGQQPRRMSCFTCGRYTPEGHMRARMRRKGKYILGYLHELDDGSVEFHVAPLYVSQWKD